MTGTAMDWAANDPSAPATYDAYLVPAMFTPLAEAVAAAADVAPGERVLDVACGTGVLTRSLALRVGADGHVTGLDLGEGMLERARAAPLQDGAAPIEYVQGSADALPFGDGAFTVVTCQQGLQFFPDRAGALAEFRRVLAPAGRLVVACWTDLRETAGWYALTEALERHIGRGLADILRAPYALSDPGDLRRLLEGAGFGDVVIEIEHVRGRFAGDPGRFAAGIAGANPAAGPYAAAGDDQRAAVVAELTLELAPLRDGDSIAFDMPSLIAVARV
jgi:SAM-dependent methyltransferase